jgi:hypothetical protein
LVKRGLKFEKCKPATVVTFVLSFYTFGLSAAIVPKREVVEDYRLHGGDWHYYHLIAIILSVCNIGIFVCNDSGFTHELDDLQRIRSAERR